MTKKTTRFTLAAAPARLSPVVHHLLDAVARDAIAGDRAAIERLARDLRAAMVDHAHAHLRHFDCDAEDVVQDVFLAMLERRLPQVPRDQSPVVWLLALIAARAGQSR